MLEVALPGALTFESKLGYRSGRMQEPLNDRHRVITAEGFVFIRKFIAEHPELSRWKLSKELCAAWNWVQANGAPRDVVCRGLMLKLHREGLIELPAARCVARNPLVECAQPLPGAAEDVPVQPGAPRPTPNA